MGRWALAVYVLALAAAAPAGAVSADAADAGIGTLAHQGMAMDPRSGPDACIRCHVRPAGRSHPVGVVPTMRVPRNLPLDARGRVTCLTCHDLSASRPGGGPALRAEQDARSLCAACHGNASGSGRRYHALSGARAHESGIRPRPVSGLDEESMRCLGCHDGSVTDAAAVGMAGALTVVPDLGRSHPVGVSYRDAVSRGAYLAPGGPASVAVLLPGGTVGCQSCHALYARHAHLLVVDNAGSALCLQCHRV